jgi:hypothetical protein
MNFRAIDAIVPILYEANSALNIERNIRVCFCEYLRFEDYEYCALG